MIRDLSELFESTPVSPAQDRRLSQRILNAWACAARGSFPSWSDMRAIDLGEDWNWVFVVDLKKSAGFPYFIYLGSRLAHLAEVYLGGETDWTVSLLDKAAERIDAAVAARGPHVEENELTLCDGRSIRFRAISAPLAEDGEDITHVLGAAFGRFTETGGRSRLKAV